MGLSGTWNPSELGASQEKRAIASFEAALISGITLFDHADIYGQGTCEAVFKKCLEAFPEARESIQIWTKTGIKNGFYDLSPESISAGIEASRRRMGIDCIDLFQLHRPDPLAHPAQSARALNAALGNGHIRAVGVSNYFPRQMEALQKYLDAPLVSNQIPLNILKVAPFYEGWETPRYDGPSASHGVVGDGTLDFCMAQNIVPLAYSPLSKAKLSRADDDENGGRESDVQEILGELSQKYDATRTQIALAWLLTHSSGIVPVVGSNNPAHIFEAAQRNDLRLEREDWYRLWTASWGRNVP